MYAVSSNPVDYFLIPVFIVWLLVIAIRARRRRPPRNPHAEMLDALDPKNRHYPPRR